MKATTILKRTNSCSTPITHEYFLSTKQDLGVVISLAVSHIAERDNRHRVSVVRCSEWLQKEACVIGANDKFTII